MNIPNNIIDELYNVLQEEITKEMDEEIIIELMESLGWIIVKNKKAWNRSAAKDWMAENLKGGYKISHGACAFELEEDASLFALTWL